MVDAAVVGGGKKLADLTVYVGCSTKHLGEGGEDLTFGTILLRLFRSGTRVWGEESNSCVGVGEDGLPELPTGVEDFCIFGVCNWRGMGGKENIEVELIRTSVNGFATVEMCAIRRFPFDFFGSPITQFFRCLENGMSEISPLPGTFQDLFSVGLVMFQLSGLTPRLFLL
jgi:hypothetical protein